jgi:hypothetical protein
MKRVAAAAVQMSKKRKTKLGLATSGTESSPISQQSRETPFDGIKKKKKKKKKTAQRTSLSSPIRTSMTLVSTQFFLNQYLFANYHTNLSAGVRASRVEWNRSPRMPVSFPLQR